MLYEVDAILKSRYDSDLKDVMQDHRAEVEAVTERVHALEKERSDLAELVESVKNTAREPERQTEHRVRIASLKPICLIHQDVVLALRNKPDLRLNTLAQTLQGALIQQGVTPFGTPDEAVDFDPKQHEHARWARHQGDSVRIVAPGYALTHASLNVRDVLVRAIVEPTDAS